MNQIFSTIALICVCMSLLFLSSCKKKDEETESKESMTGTLLSNIPSCLYKSRTYTFTASGITSPQGLSYKWVASSFIPDSSIVQTYSFTTPESVGDYSLSLTASFDGYNNAYKVQTITIIDSLFFDCIAGIAEGEDYIEDPRDGAIYHTRVYGELEWFVQNLSWAGAGNAYSKAEALSTPFGRLYSWNEAVTGISAEIALQSGPYDQAPAMAFNGIGAGPQGVCPPGWSVPTNEDWAHLATVVNGGTPLSFFDPWDNIADPLCAYAKLNGDYLWPYSPRNTKSNSAFWNGLPAGSSTNNGNNYANMGAYGFWLSSSEADADNGYYRYIHYDVNQFPYHHTNKNTFGASIRCVRLVEAGDEG